MAVTAGETTTPKRTLPRALVGSMLATGVLYFFIVLVFISVIPADSYDSATLSDVGRALAGPVGGIVIALTAVFSIAGNLAGSMISAPRLVFAMAEHQTLPAMLARVHPTHATPHVSILLYGGLALELGLTGSFVVLAVASSVVRLLGYVICIASLPVIRRKMKGAPDSFRLPGGYAIPAVAMVICVWLLAQSKLQSWIVVGALLAVGAVLYLRERRIQNAGE